MPSRGGAPSGYPVGPPVNTCLLRAFFTDQLSVSILGQFYFVIISVLNYMAVLLNPFTKILKHFSHM